MGDNAAVVYSPVALADLDAAWDWVEETTGSARQAASVVAGIQNRVELLAAFPFSGTPLSSVCNLQTGYRFVSAMGYVAFYHVAEGEVRVDRVLSQRSDRIAALFPGLTELDS